MVGLSEHSGPERAVTLTETGVLPLSRGRACSPRGRGPFGGALVPSHSRRAPSAGGRPPGAPFATPVPGPVEANWVPGDQPTKAE